MKSVSFRTTVLCAMMLMFLLLSCSKNEIIEPGSTNTPSYASHGNSFSYFIDADKLTLDQRIPLTFTSDSLSYALSVSNYSAGKASITVHADSICFTSSDIFFNTNQAFRFSMMGCLPDSITLTFSTFTGRISLAVAGISHAHGGRASIYESFNGGFESSFAREVRE